jgi:hypothetical protein
MAVWLIQVQLQLLMELLVVLVVVLLDGGGVMVHHMEEQQLLVKVMLVGHLEVMQALVVVEQVQ